MCNQDDHERRKRPSQWPGISLLAVWDLEGRKLELKNCPICHSTLAVALEKKDAGNGRPVCDIGPAHWRSS